MSWRPAGSGRLVGAPPGVPLGCAGCWIREPFPAAERVALGVPWVVRLAEPALEPVLGLVGLARAAGLRFAGLVFEGGVDALAFGVLAFGVLAFEVELACGAPEVAVDASAAVSAGREARFWLRRCGREWGSPPSTSDDRLSLIGATSSHQARFLSEKLPELPGSGTRYPALEEFADKLKHRHLYGVVAVRPRYILHRHA